MDAKLFVGEPRAMISRSALLHNAAVIRRAIGEKTGLCAVVKANAYGHGADLVVDTLCNFAQPLTDRPLIDALAVASIDEAEALPCSSLPVLILRPAENTFLGQQRSRLELAIRSGWILTVCSASAADDVARVALACKCRATVQVMIDTGMCRSGASPLRLNDLIAHILSHPSLKLWGFGTHLACSENRADPFNAEQLARYRNATESAPLRRLTASRSLVRHVANSGGVFLHPEAHLDMVRPGISLYGIDPAGRPNLDRPLKPVMKWTASLLMIRDVKKGDAVGYNQTWRAPRDTRIGLVPVGYADGYLRCYSNRAMMMVCGQAVPVVGRVSMDLTTLDLGDVPQANVGDEVTILDDDPLSPVSVYELAKWADTIPYEIFCRIGQRIHRIPVDAHEAAASSDTSGSASSEPTM